MNNSIAPLFVPAYVARLREKAVSLELSALLLDLEDAVPGTEKEAARRGAQEMLQRLPGTCRVRINPLQVARRFGTACGHEDLAAIVQPGLAGIVAPKIDSSEALLEVDAALRTAECAAGLPEDALELGVTIETAAGVVNLREIANTRVARPWRLLFGMGDLTTDLGIDWTHNESECAVARSLIPLAARAANLGRPYDTVFTDVADVEGLRASTMRGKALGFGGKAAIHPRQIETILAAYRPTEAELLWSRRVVSVAEQRSALGEGAFLLEGRMIDDPIVVRAREVLELAARLA
jgi:citrate lyase beta subunit